MSYDILEKTEKNGMWEVRAKIDDTRSLFLNFRAEPSQDEVDNAIEKLLASEKMEQNFIGGKSQYLIEAEQAYISFCRSLGLDGKVGTAEIETVCMSLIGSGVQENINQGLLVAAKSLALINGITQAGGTWYEISWE